ncbi:MAG: GDSL-type esterase/lipase family protein [Niabella sp.]
MYQLEKKYRKIFLSVSFLIHGCLLFLCAGATFYPADHPAIRYAGRLQEVGNMKRLWSPGAFFEFAFKGDTCRLVLGDEVRYGVQHNYIEIQLDNEPALRLRLQSNRDTITLVPLSKKKKHTLLVAKNTEASIGYIDVIGVQASAIAFHKSSGKRLIEFIGDSITCGASADTSLVKCGAGRWEDQHNAYMAYGPVAARRLHADWVLTSVSGIGLMHSCCNMTILMPQVFDKADTRNDSIQWDFKNYTPDVVTVCLGQNDGIQEAGVFEKKYIEFIRQVRAHYPGATIVLLTSPMADEKLKSFMVQRLRNVEQAIIQSGDKNIAHFVFKGRYIAGCDYHPSVSEHSRIAEELISFFQEKQLLKRKLKI